MQGGRGGDATAAASVVTPVMLTWALSGMVAAPLLVRWGFRRTAALGAMLIVLGFGGLLVCAMTGAPQWVVTGALAVTGFGFGPASMSFLVAAQESVTYAQRGIVTGSVSFFRTMGGAVGIGLLGGFFNILTAPQSARLRADGLKPAELLDPHAHASIPPTLLEQARHLIALGLTWVFASMLAIALVLWVVTRLMPARACVHKVRAREAMDAV